MACEIENYSKFEVRTMISFLQAEKFERARSALSRTEVSLWRNAFKDGRTALNDDAEKHRG
jgi:hypothetical protein